MANKKQQEQILDNNDNREEEQSNLNVPNIDIDLLIAENKKLKEEIEELKNNKKQQEQILDNNDNREEEQSNLNVPNIDIDLLIAENKKLKEEIEELKNKQNKKEKHCIEEIKDYNNCFINAGTGDFSFQFEGKTYSINELKGRNILLSNQLLKENPKLNRFITNYSNKVFIIK